MDNSPKGRRIEWIDGNADDIIVRGTEIENLGLQMQVSAGILRQIADGASGMEGLSFDKIQEVTGDVYEELQLAGERYSPTGVALKEYGTTLSEVQSGLSALIEACETAWNTFETKRNDHLDLEYEKAVAEGTGATPADLEAAGEAADEAESDMDTANSDFITEADRFDVRYDTWEAAFELAVTRIGDATTGGITDSWEDDFDEFVNAVLEVLAWVGLAIAILGLIIGGPIFAVLAAIVAIATLVGTIYLAIKGKKDGWDVAFAVIGVLPFGKLATVFKPGGAVGALKALVAVDEFAELGGAFKSGWSAAAPGLISKLAGGGKGLWAGIGQDVTFGTVDMLAPLFGGNTMSEITTFMESGSGTASVIVSHVIDWNIKTIVLPIVLDLGPQVQDWSADAASTSQADSWSEQLAASN